MHRIAIFVAVLCSLLMAGASGAVAQEATPTTNPALAGYPELKVTVTDNAIQVDKTEIPAGYVLLTVTNSTAGGTSAGVIGPGPGKTMDDLSQAAATPAPGQEFPPFLYDAVILGGPPEIQAGGTGQALLNVPAGDWAVFPEGNQPPTMISAVDGPESNTTAPSADFSLELGDFFFSGLADDVPSGPAIWKVTNSGKQPHMLVIAKIPDGSTEQQVLDSIGAIDFGTPVPGGLQESDFQFTNAGLLLLSSAESMWIPTDLEQGTYVAMCYVTDPATGQPHIMEGMVSVFQVGAGTATPTY